MHWLFLSLENGCQFGLMLLHVSGPKFRHHSFVDSFGLMLLHVSGPKFSHHSFVDSFGLMLLHVSGPKSRHHSFVDLFGLMLLHVSKEVLVAVHPADGLGAGARGPRRCSSPAARPHR